ncbi:hypothetical protein FBU31_007340 [Coemansia sp. 'formosensis']|nr:hypothetical protein FBU31_007340 [Coemansia sp. 'formosensis']
MHMPRFIHTPVHVSKEQSDGVIYTHSSDFVHPQAVEKEEISCPVAAKPMPIVDVTANDWVYTGGTPSRNELRAIKKHVKQTARMLGTDSKKIIEAQGEA